MPNLSLSVLVTRSLLGLSDLELNDHLNYAIAPQFLGAALTWTKQQVTSPFADSSYTVQRSRGSVNEPVGVEIYAESGAELQANTQALIDAFTQDHFVMTVAADGATFDYQCEAADYQVMSWTGPRLISHQGQVLFTVPRHPTALSGVY